MVIEIARRVLTWYLSAMPAISKIYDALATLPILLIWIYTAWVIVLSGAVLVSLLPGVLLRRVRVADGPGWVLAQSIETLRLLEQARADNHVGLTLAELARQLRFDPAELEGTMRQLMDLGWVAQLDGDDRLVLVVQPEQTPVAVLLRQLLLSLYQATQLIWQGWDKMTLADLLRQPAQIG